MAWTKTGDNAEEHPVVLEVLALTDGDYLLANAAYGFVHRCATHAAGHTTDYFISDGVTWSKGGPVAKQLCDLAERAGYWTRAEVGGRKGWQLIDDPGFIHIRLKAELDWERQQKKDVRNTKLTVPVRLRDGDACRYCGVVVYFVGDRKSGRNGTYDHRRPGEPATSPEDLVVACGSCNAGRKDDPDADVRYPLLPPPKERGLEPYYHAPTAAWLAKYGHHVRASDERPGDEPGEPRDPATSGTPRRRDPATSGSTRGEPSGHRKVAPPLAPVVPLAPRDPAARGTPRRDLPGPADQLPDGSGFVGSGRDRDGPGSGHGVGSGSRPPPERRRTRSRRGARGRPRSGGSR